MSLYELFSVNVRTEEVEPGWERTGPEWCRTQATTPAEALAECIGGHLCEARNVLDLESRAGTSREIHTLEQAQAYLLGHVAGCGFHKVEARACACSQVSPSTLTAVVSELRRIGPLTHRELAQALGLDMVTVRAALLRAHAGRAVRLNLGGTWEAF